MSDYSNNIYHIIGKTIPSLPSLPPNDVTFLCQDFTSIIILKKNEPFNLELEKGEKYQISYFGDESDKIIKILQKEGKIKLM